MNREMACGCKGDEHLYLLYYFFSVIAFKFGRTIQYYAQSVKIFVEMKIDVNFRRAIKNVHIQGIERLQQQAPTPIPKTSILVSRHSHALLHSSLTTTPLPPYTLPPKTHLLIHQTQPPNPLRISLHQPLPLPPLPLRGLPRPAYHNFLILHPIQITLLTLPTPLPPIRAKMLAKMQIPLLPNISPTNITHGVPANTDEFVAARGFDKGDVALWACSFDGVCDCGFDECAQGEPRGLVADVDVGPER